MRVWTILACGKICWRIAELCWSNGNKNNNMISKEIFCKVIALMQEQDQVNEQVEKVIYWDDRSFDVSTPEAFYYYMVMMQPEWNTQENDNKG